MLAFAPTRLLALKMILWLSSIEAQDMAFGLRLLEKSSSALSIFDAMISPMISLTSELEERRILYLIIHNLAQDGISTRQ